MPAPGAGPGLTREHVTHSSRQRMSVQQLLQSRVNQILSLSQRSPQCPRETAEAQGVAGSVQAEMPRAVPPSSHDHRKLLVQGGKGLAVPAPRKAVPLSPDRDPPEVQPLSPQFLAAAQACSGDSRLSISEVQLQTSRRGCQHRPSAVQQEAARPLPTSTPPHMQSPALLHQSLPS